MTLKERDTCSLPPQSVEVSGGAPHDLQWPHGKMQRSYPIPGSEGTLLDQLGNYTWWTGHLLFSALFHLQKPAG